MPTSSRDRAAVRRCHRTLALSLALFGAAGAGIASLVSPALPQAVPAVRATVTDAVRLAEATLLAPPALTLAAKLPEMIPDVVPLPKPDVLLAAISTPGRPIAASEMTCLAEAVYYEARGESVDGQRAVAEVVVRRSGTRNYPKTICGVVYQDSHRANSCQFSFACDGISHGRRDAGAWKRAVAVAEYEVAGAGRHENLTGNATHFHAVRVNPSWSRRYVRTVQIGNHVFYRQPGTAEASVATPAS